MDREFVESEQIEQYELEPDQFLVEESELDQPFLTDNDICLQETGKVIPYSESVHNENMLLEEKMKEDRRRFAIREDHQRFNPHNINRANLLRGAERANCLQELIGYVTNNPLKENPEAASEKAVIDRLRATRNLSFFRPEKVKLNGYTYEFEIREREYQIWARKQGPNDIEIREALINRILSSPLVVNPEAEAENKALNKERIKTFAAKKIISRPLMKDLSEASKIDDDLLYGFVTTEDGIDIDQLENCEPSKG